MIGNLSWPKKPCRLLFGCYFSSLHLGDYLALAIHALIVRMYVYLLMCAYYYIANLILI